MSRTFPSVALQRSILCGSAIPVQFLKFAFGGGTLRVTTAPFDITWDGFTWQAVGGLLDFDALQESSDKNSGTLKIRLSGVDQSFISLVLAERYLGRTVDIWFGWVAGNSNLVPNSSAEVNTSGFAANLGTETVQRITDLLDPTQFSFLISLVNTAGSGAFINDGAAHFNVIPGQPYFARLLARTQSSIVPMQLRLAWHDAGLSFLSQATTSINLQPGQNQLVEVSGIAPSNATRALVLFTAVSAPGTPDIHIREIQLAPGLLGLFQPTSGVAAVGGTILSSPLEMFSGFMNGGFEISQSLSDRESQTCVVEGRAQGRLAVLSQPAGFRSNLESHQSVYARDMFFEFVPGLSGQTITWGLTKNNLVWRKEPAGFR